MSRLRKVIATLIMPVAGVLLLPCAAMAANDEIPLAAGIVTSEPVTVTYMYEITPNSQNQPGESNLPRQVQVKFDNTQPGAGGTAIGGTMINFSGASYVNTGVYKYTVREVASDNPAYPPSDLAYEIYVQVTENAGIMEKDVYRLALNLSTNVKENMNFTHGERTTYITVDNYADGLLTDIGTVFRYRLEVAGPVGDRYTILGQPTTARLDVRNSLLAQPAALIYNGQTVTPPDVYEVKAGSDNYTYIYMRDAQTVTVGLARNGDYQVPVGTKYRLIKDKVDKWYTTINNQHYATEWEQVAWLTAGANPAMNKIVVENYRDFDVPLTGVILNLLPFVVLILMAWLGITLIKKVGANEKRGKKQR